MGSQGLERTAIHSFQSRLILVPTAGLLLVGMAFADGKIFSPVTRSVNIPDQSALLCFDGTTERLVIENRYEGVGRHFGWVVPLPTEPKVEKVSPGVFPTLRFICRPRLVYRWSYSALSLLVIATVPWLFAFSGRPRRLFDSMVFVIILLTFCGVPSVHYMRSTASSRGHAAAVKVLNRGRVGAYDVATLSAPNAGALMKWLVDNKFKTEPALEPVLQDYVERGWVFVAYKFSREVTAVKTSRTHPLSFTFPTVTAVYPLRMTGVGNGRLSLDLYVAGKHEARAPHLRRERVARLGFIDPAGERIDETDSYGNLAANDDRIPIVHQGLRDLMKGHTFCTKLTGSLSAREMNQDLVLSWRDPRPYRKRSYTRGAARNLALLWSGGAAIVVTLAGMAYGAMRGRATSGFAVLATGALGFCFAASTKKPETAVLAASMLFAGVYLVAHPFLPLEAQRADRRFLLRLLTVTALVSIIIGLVAWIRLDVDKKAVPGARRPQRSYEELLEQVMGAREWRAAIGKLMEMSASELRMSLAEALRNEAAGTYRNLYTGEPLREEASPGNYTVEEIDGAPALIVYNASGARGEHHWTADAREERKAAKQ